MSVVAKDSGSESIQRLARLSRDAITCVGRNGEPLIAYIERCTTPAFAFLNLTACEKSSAESQNLAVAMVTNARLTSMTHTAVMAALVSAAKNRNESDTSTISLDKSRIEAVRDCLETVSSFDEDQSQITDQVVRISKESLTVIKNAISTADQKQGDEAGVCRVALTDAISTLEEVNLDTNAD